MKRRVENIYHYDVVFESNGDGYTVTVPRIKGLVTEGDTLAEARMMARDAIRCALEAALKERSLTFRRKRAPESRRVAVGA